MSFQIPPNWSYGYKKWREVTGYKGWVCGTGRNLGYQIHMSLPVYKMTKSEWNEAIMNDNEHSMAIRVVGTEGIPEIQIDNKWHRIELEG